MIEKLEVVKENEKIKIFKKINLRHLLKIGVGLALMIALLVFYIDLINILIIYKKSSILSVFYTLGIWVSIAFFFLPIFLGLIIQKEENKDSIILNREKKILIYRKDSYDFHNIEHILIETYSLVRFEGQIKGWYIMAENKKIELPEYDREEIKTITSIFKENTDIKIKKQELKDDIPESTESNRIWKKKFEIKEFNDRKIIEIRIDVKKSFIKGTIFSVSIIMFIVVSISLLEIIMTQILSEEWARPSSLFSPILIASLPLVIIYDFYELRNQEVFDKIMIDHTNGVININGFENKISQNAIIQIRKQRIGNENIEDAIIKQGEEKIYLPFISDDRLLREMVKILSEELNIEIVETGFFRYV